jgi:DnaJ-class molecular chaperone
MKKFFVILIAFIGFGVTALTINYVNASDSKKVEVKEEQNDYCRACNGVGYFVCEKWVYPTCTSCKGKGYLELYTKEGRYEKVTCTACNGNGTTKQPCPKCKSTGKRTCTVCNGTGKN